MPYMLFKLVAIAQMKYVFAQDKRKYKGGLLAVQQY